MAARSPAYGDATSSLKIALLLRLSTVARESWRPGSPSDNRKRWRGLSSISVAAGGLRPEGRSQRLAAAGGEGRSRRVPVDSGAGACGEPHPLGPPDPAVTNGPGALGSGRPCGGARSSVRDRPPRTSQPRCAPAPSRRAMRGGACHASGGDPGACAERGN
jgi:hypothetical protein